VASYADLADVQQAMAKMTVALTDTSVPSKSDVTSTILPAISGIIDGVLSARGLVTPVTAATAPDSFLQSLRGLTAVGAAARTVAGLFPQAAGPSSTTFADWLQARFDDGLKMLRAGEGIPPSIGRIAALARSYWTSHPFDDDGVTTTKPTFTRKMVW
jgi:hypothetical protein